MAVEEPYTDKSNPAYVSRYLLSRKALLLVAVPGVALKLSGQLLGAVSTEDLREVLEHVMAGLTPLERVQYDDLVTFDALRDERSLFVDPNRPGE